MSVKPPDYSALRFWCDLGQFLITGGIGVWVWLANRLNAKSKEVEKVNTSVVLISERVSKLETEKAHSLSHEDLAAVYERINGMAEEVANLAGKMDGVKGAVDMIQEYLLNGNRGK